MNTEPSRTPDDPIFIALLNDWDPVNRPVHCSNCAHCIVTGDGINHPVVRCARGHQGASPTITLWRMLRRKHPSAFRAAAQCPDFESMD